MKLPSDTAKCGCKYGEICPHDCCKTKSYPQADGSFLTIRYYPVHFRMNLKENDTQATC